MFWAFRSAIPPHNLKVTVLDIQYNMRGFHTTALWAEPRHNKTVLSSGKLFVYFCNTCQKPGKKGRLVFEIRHVHNSLQQTLSAGLKGSHIGPSSARSLSKRIALRRQCAAVCRVKDDSTAELSPPPRLRSSRRRGVCEGFTPCPSYPQAANTFTKCFEIVSVSGSAAMQ